MSTKASITLRRESKIYSDDLLCEIQVHDHGLLGKNASFVLVREVDVHDSRGINRSDILFARKFVLDSATESFAIPGERLRAFSYCGDLRIPGTSYPFSEFRGHLIHFGLELSMMSPDYPDYK